MDSSSCLKEIASTTSVSVKEQELKILSEANPSSISNLSQDLELASSTSESEVSNLGASKLKGTQKKSQNDQIAGSCSQNGKLNSTDFLDESTVKIEGIESKDKKQVGVLSVNNSMSVDLEDENTTLTQDVQNICAVDVRSPSSERKLTLSQPIFENNILREPRFKRRVTYSQPIMESDLLIGQPRFKRRRTSVSLGESKNWYIEYKHQKQLVLKTQRQLHRANDKLKSISTHLKAL